MRSIIISTGVVSTLLGVAGSAGGVNGEQSVARLNGPVSCHHLLLKLQRRTVDLHLSVRVRALRRVSPSTPTATRCC